MTGTYLAILFYLFFVQVCLAQQNFFNVPNSEITTKGHSFFQEQINTNPSTFSLNSTYDYGVAEEWEIGANLLGANIDRQVGQLTHNYQVNAGPLTPSLLLNTQKGFSLTEHIHLGLGAQGGSSLELRRDQHLPYYTYGNFEYTAHNSEFLFVVGAFHANKAYQGAGKGWLQIGLEFPLIDEKLHFVGDYINGNSSISQGVVGLCYFPFPYYSISAGHQFPSPHAPTGHSTVVEFTFLPHGTLHQGKR